MKIRIAVPRLLAATIPATVLALAAPVFAGSAVAAAPATPTTSVTSVGWPPPAAAPAPAAGLTPFAVGSLGGTTGICAANYPALTPYITVASASWWSFSSTDFTWIGGIRTCGFTSKPAVVYACTGGQGSKMNLQTIGGLPSGPQNRRTFAMTCDGVRHTIPAATAWAGFTQLPFHIHWHAGDGHFQNGYLAIR